jgi:pimeloyl-ACP methyl ester carboxylesterase
MLPYFARMPEIDISERLANINCPVLLMAGAEDPAVPDAQAQLVAERVPEAELHIFPAVGHLPMLEAGETYHAALSDWLARVVRR